MLAFPPHQTKVSIAVSQSTALAHLSKYLALSDRHPHLLPNAHLDPSRGPTVGSSKFSVTIYNLRRVEAGLRGEWLDPNLEFNQFNPTSNSVNNQGTKKNDEDEDINFTQGEKSFHDESVMTQEETQTLQQLQESDEDFPKLNRTGVNHDPLQDINPIPIDKDARKKAKKARRKIQKMNHRASKS